MSHFEQALAIHREVGNRRMEGIALGNLGNACLDKGRVDDAVIHLTQALEIHREVGNRRDEAIALANLGRLRSGQHRSVEAHELYDAALTIAREGGYRPFEGYLLLMTSDELRDEGRIEEALARCEQALVVLHDVRNTRHEGAALSLRGDLLAQLRRFDEARASLQAGEALLRKVGDRHALVRLLCARGHAEAAAGGVAARPARHSPPPRRWLRRAASGPNRSPGARSPHCAKRSRDVASPQGLQAGQLETDVATRQRQRLIVLGGCAAVEAAAKKDGDDAGSNDGVAHRPGDDGVDRQPARA